VLDPSSSSRPDVCLRDRRADVFRRVRRARYVAANTVKNAVAPVLIPVKPGRSLGLDGDPREVLLALDEMAEALESLARPIQGQVVLELGPGRTPELLAAFVLGGAGRGIGLDTVVSIPEDYDDPARYRSLLAAMSTGCGRRFVNALNTSPAQMWEDLEGRTEPWPVDYSGYDGTHIPLREGEVDLVVSKSVLEHVRRGQVEHLLSELRRVVGPGGAMVHAVDLRDHMHICGDKRAGSGWTDALTYPEKIFNAMFWNRSTYINRYRVDDWRTLLERTGWRVTSWRERRWPLPPGLVGSKRLRPEWRHLSAEDLAVGFLWFAAKRRP
jgi:hypothetical protein